jgi:hypothetical protein
MTRAGGAAAKSGVTYEGLWTARTLAQLLAEQIAAIHLEPPRGHGIEFTVEHPDGRREHHQCKARSSGVWSIRDLEVEGVLAALAERTAAGDDFVFVSSASSRDLPYLTDLARKGETFEEFYELLDGGRADRFRTLAQHFGLPQPASWESLRRARFRHSDAQLLREDAENLLAAVAVVDPSSAVSRLVEYSLVETSRRVTAARLWADMKYPRRSLVRDPSVLATLSTIRSRYIDQAREEKIAGRRFIRQEVAQVVQLLSGADNGSRVVVKAEAGAGKSVALAQLVIELEARSVLCLPLRLDRIHLDHAPEVVGAHLGLPGSPATVLAGAAAGDPAVLVIDQLDAVSQVSGRKPEFLACVETMLRELRPFPNIAVVLACREFDLGADPRLAALTAKPNSEVVSLGGLLPAQVDEVLELIHVDPATLTSSQRALLASPLHLRLLAEAPGKAFRTALDLYSEAWDAKRRRLASTAPHLVEIVETLCAEVNRQRRLFVSPDVVDRWAPEVEALLSERLLIPADGGEIGFFHEGFFDFVSAKALAGQGVPLIDFVTATDQDLFHRAQVKQVLVYRRDTDRAAYLSDLADVLGSPVVRFHLKSLTTDWLGSLSEPSVDEWRAIAPQLVAPDDPLSVRIINLLRNPAWFDVVDSLGLIEGWLFDEGGEFVNAATSILAGAQRSRGARAGRLLAQFPRDNDVWRSRIRWIVQSADLDADESFFQVVVDLTREGALDELTRVFAGNGSFWDLGQHLKGSRVAWFSRLAAAYLHRRIDLAAAAGVRNPFVDNKWIPDPLARSAFVESARADPHTYVEELLPVMRRLIEATSPWNEVEQRWDDRVWRYRWRGRAYGAAHELLGGMEEALGLLAESEPARFGELANDMAAARSETLDFLLVRAFARASASMAERAAAFLIEKPVRLNAGYTSDHWGARELVGAIFPELDAATRTALETTIMEYYPSWERSARGIGRYGAAQHAILGGISGLTGKTRKRFDELVRKFGQKLDAPRPPEVISVGSPIDPDRSDRMTDRQWLKAIAKYSDDRMPDRPIFHRGGAAELAAVFAQHVAGDSVRFLPLALRLPAHTHEVYYESMLRALKEAHGSADRGLLWDLVRRAETLPRRSCARVICDITAALAETGTVPADILDIVVRYALDDDHPLVDVPADTSLFSAEDQHFAPSSYGGMELVNQGLNTDRGRAVLAIGKMLWAQPQLLGRLETTLSTAADDGSAAVRVCVVEALLPILAIDRDRAVALYLRAVGEDTGVAASEVSARFLRYSLRTHFRQVEHVLDLLLSAVDDEANRVGGREAVLASFEEQAVATGYVERVLTGTRGSRFGAAEVFAANVGDEGIGEGCEEPLRLLFSDPEAPVRSEAASAFRSFDEGQLAQHLGLLTAFMDSPAIADESSPALAAILRIDGQLPDIAGHACLRILDIAGPAAGDLSTAHSADMPDIAAIAVRLNAFGTEEGRILGLDVFDRLCELGAYGVDRALALFER